MRERAEETERILKADIGSENLQDEAADDLAEKYGVGKKQEESSVHAHPEYGRRMNIHFGQSSSSLSTDTGAGSQGAAGQDATGQSVQSGDETVHEFAGRTEVKRPAGEIIYNRRKEDR